jgi:probable rRNA maturation factor
MKVNLVYGAAAWKKAFPRMKGKIEKAAAAAYAAAKKPTAFRGRSFEITILLATDAQVRRLNRDYRGKDKPTNVLAFPQMDLRRKPAVTDVTPSLGDIALALQTIKRECREQKKSIENHILHLVVHGTLHLLGYDHMNARDAKAMESLECDILTGMGYPAPYDLPLAAKNGRDSPHARRRA